MEYLIIVLVPFLLGLAIGGTLGWLITALYSKARMAHLETQHAADLDKVDWVNEAEQYLREAFENLARASLLENEKHFSGRMHHLLANHAHNIDQLKLSLESSINQLERHSRQYAHDLSGKMDVQLETHAKGIGVVRNSLEFNIRQLEQNVHQLEVKREGAYTDLSKHVTNLEHAHRDLTKVTDQLVNALSSGPIRGRWGEIQLRKIVELSGMSEHVSFVEQVAGLSGRPDMVVRLPNHGQLVVDSKFPLQAFLAAMASTDTTFRKEKLEEHTKVLKQTITNLSNKEYWADFDPSPELVVLFIPVESCLMVAYECDPEIIEFALERKVVLASPITLLGFMKSIAYGWQQFKISKEAKRILKQAKELHQRADTWLGHFRDTGKKLSGLVEAYNKCVASLQSRFFPACRKFEELSAIAEALEDVDTVSKGIHLAPESQEIQEESLPAAFPSEAEPLEVHVPMPLGERPSVVVIWESVSSTPAIALVVHDMDLWRSLDTLGYKCRRLEFEQKDSDGNLVIDAKGYRPLVDESGLPTLLITDRGSGRVMRHCRLPETREEILQLVTEASCSTSKSPSSIDEKEFEFFGVR